MRKEDVVQEVSLLGFPYARIVSRQVTREDAERLKQRYQYIHIYSFTKEDLPEFTARVQKTPIFDLSEHAEGLFGKFNDTCKKHIRRADRNPDLKLVALDTDGAASYALYARIKSQEGAYPDLKREFENCIFFNAYLKGEMIVTMSFYDNGEIIRAKHIASVRKEKSEDAKIVAQASRRLNWEVMQWGKAHGRTLFDLGGITDDPAKAGIREFKNSFGGHDVEAYIYRYTTPVFAVLKKTLPLIGKNIN